MAETYGAALRAARQAAGKTLAEVGKAIGVSAPYVCEVERGNRGPLSRDRTFRAAGLLGSDFVELERLRLAHHLRGIVRADLVDQFAETAARHEAMVRRRDQNGPAGFAEAYGVLTDG